MARSRQKRDRSLRFAPVTIFLGNNTRHPVKSSRQQCYTSAAVSRFAPKKFALLKVYVNKFVTITQTLTNDQ